MDSRSIQREIDGRNNELRNLNGRLKSLNSDLTRYNKDLDQKFRDLKAANYETRIKQLQNDIENCNKRISAKQKEIDQCQKQIVECQNKINKLSTDLMAALQSEAEKQRREDAEKLKRQQEDLRNKERQLELERNNKEQAQRAEYERNRKALEKQRAEAEERFKRQQKEFERKQIESSRETYYEPPVYEEFERCPGCLGTTITSVLIVFAAIVVIFVVASILGRFTGNDKPATSQLANTPTESSVSNDSEEILGQVVVVIDELFVRSMPSTEGNIPKEFAKMDVVYNVYDIYTDDQYTWYRIGEDQWIADYNGEWVNWVEVDE